jgi:hypothetical protein
MAQGIVRFGDQIDGSCYLVERGQASIGRRNIQQALADKPAADFRIERQDCAGFAHGAQRLT